MRVGIVAKGDEPRRVKIAGMVAEHLRGKAEILAEPPIADDLVDAEACELEKMKVDVIVTVGGDGTILYAMQKNLAPVFGINVGELGFLTEIDPIELMDGLDRLVAHEYYLESRMKLAVRLGDERLPDAVNDAVVKTGRVSKIIKLNLSWNEGSGAEGLSKRQTSVELRADGLIASTSTGTSSYAMSAGGPIVDPRLDAITIVPIAPFSLSSRPIVLPTSMEVCIEAMEPNKEPIVVVDGQYEREMQAGEVLRVTGSSHRARFVRFRNQFYSRLKERLR